MNLIFRSIRRSAGVFITALVLFSCARHPMTGTSHHFTEKATEEQQSAGIEGTRNGDADPRKIVVARVNNVELYMDALITMMNRLAPGDGNQQNPLEEHKKRSLDKLILQELAYQQVKAQGAGIEIDKIDMAISNFRTNVGGAKEYAAYLDSTNLTEADLRAQVERSLTIELMYAREVLAKVVVPEDQVRQEYEKEKHLYILPEKAWVIDVFILDDKEKKANEKKARELLRRIQADPEKDPWNLVLDGTFIVRSLEIGTDQEKELLEAARKLKPRDLSGIIETPRGSHIIKLKNYSPERQMTFEEVRNGLESRFRVPAQQNRMLEWEQELRNGARIEIL